MLQELPSELESVQYLQALDLNENEIKSVSPVLLRLQWLRSLRLSNNMLKSLPDGLLSLEDIKELYLNNNLFSTMPAGLSKLKQLEVLNLRNNLLKTIPTSIRNLDRLRRLDVTGNKISTLPLFLGHSPNLEELSVSENPLLEPPPEIVSQGSRAIITYLRERSHETTVQWVSKLLLVGEGGVGKTSLLRALNREPFDPESSTTHGLNVAPLVIPHPDICDIEMTLNTWDFGGQEIYHATHQFFLTNRSLFVLIWNARIGFEQSKIYYWLDRIQALAPSAPVIVLATHSDERDAELPEADLRSRYSQIRCFAHVSNKTGDGIGGVREKIAELAASLPLMGESWPTTWLSAADAVRDSSETYVSLSALHDIYREHKVTPESFDILTRWLHDLGSVLHFSHDSELRDVVLLKPQWVSEKISEVLECPDVIASNGIFRHNHMDSVWADLHSSMREKFLRLMERFDLSYRIPEDPENKSLVVERLSLDPPDISDLWDEAACDPRHRELSMVFDLNSTLPAGIPTWFIARSHRFSTGRHWRYGAVFADHKHGRHVALVQAPPGGKIVSLSVRGPNPQSFFTLLRDGIEVTLARFPGLRPRRFVPCPGHDGESCSHNFELVDLERARDRDPPVLEVQCPKSFENMSIAAMLYGIHWSTHSDVISRLDELHRDQLRHISVSDDIFRSQKHNFEALMELVQRQFVVLFNAAQGLEESHCPRVFSLRPKKRRKWPDIIENIFNTEWVMELYCEAPGCWHPVGKEGRYNIYDPAKWVGSMAPYLSRLVKVLRFAAPLLGPWVAYSDSYYKKLFESDIALMKELVAKLPQITELKEVREADAIPLGARDPSASSGASLRSTRRLLGSLDPDQRWGGLQKVLTPEGHYLWLCPYHAREYDGYREVTRVMPSPT